jgi:hypothetical protein
MIAMVTMANSQGLEVSLENSVSTHDIPSEGVVEANTYVYLTNNTSEKLVIDAGVRVVSEEQYTVNYCYGYPWAECVTIPAAEHNTGQYYFISPEHELGPGETSEQGDNNKLQLLLDPSSPKGQVILDLIYVTGFNSPQAEITQIFDIGTTSVSENPLGVEFGSVFPNPATDFISIEFASPSIKDAEYIVLDVNGTRVAEGSLDMGQSNLEIATDQLPAGNYFFVAADSGVYSAVKKFSVR